MIALSLPWPPSANTYYRSVMGRVLISKEGRQYRQTVQATALEQRVGGFIAEARVSVRVHAFPPDRRRRDLDNMLKPMLDAMTHAGLWVDDSQIDELSIRRADVQKDGRMFIEVVEIAG